MAKLERFSKDPATDVALEFERIPAPVLETFGMTARGDGPDRTSLAVAYVGATALAGLTSI